MLSSITQNIPSLNLLTSNLPELSLSFSKAKTITLIATAILAATSFVQTTEAGPVAYAACMSACTAATGGAFVPMCMAICAPAGAAPGP